jgi:hypothetical protein
MARQVVYDAHGARQHKEIKPMSETTQTQQWLADGHRHDDPELWVQFCEWLEEHGAAHQSSIPYEFYYLTIRSNENTYWSWLYENQLSPVWYRHGHSSKGGNGYLAKKDWRDRIAIMKDPTPEKILAWWRALLAKWKADNERFSRVDDQGRIVEENTTFENATHFTCTSCTNTSARHIVALSEADRALGNVPIALHTNEGQSSDCMLWRLWFKIDQKQREMALAAIATRLGEHTLSHIASDEQIATGTRYGLHVQLPPRSTRLDGRFTQMHEASTVTYLVTVSDDDSIEIHQVDDIPDPDCEICEMLRKKEQAQ